MLSNSDNRPVLLKLSDFFDVDLTQVISKTQNKKLEYIYLFFLTFLWCVAKDEELKKISTCCNSFKEFKDKKAHSHFFMKLMKRI